MKMILCSLGLALISALAFADTIVINNQTAYPKTGKPGKIALQWAVSTKAVQKANLSILKRSQLNSGSLVILSKKGKSRLPIPHHAKYLRIVVWSRGQSESDFLTNWVPIVSDKNYVVNQNQLIPSILLSGGGC